MDKPLDSARTPGFIAPAITEREKNAIVGGVLLSMLLAALDQTIVAPALPTIGASLGHAQYLPWIVTGYLLTATALSPLYGKISDIYGRRPVIYTAILIFMAGSLVSALSTGMFMLIGGRALQGLGGGGLLAMTQTVIGDLVPPRERALYAAWISGTWAIASIAGPLLGGYFADHLHWSLIFWINLPLGLFAIMILNKPLRKLDTVTLHHSVDVPGAVLLVAATAALLLALNWGGSTYAWLSAPILWLLAGALFLAFALAARLATAREPLISVEVLAHPVILAATLAIFLIQGVNLGLSVYLPVYLQLVLKLSVSDSGLALLGLLLGTVAGAMSSGKLVAIVEHYRRIALAGALLATTCLAVLGFLVAEHPSFLLVELLTAGAGIGAGMTYPVCTISVQNAVDRAHLGAATGVLTFMRSLGGALGVAVLGAIALGYGLPLGREGIISSSNGLEAAAPFTVIFLASAAAMAVGAALLFLMPEKPLQGRAERAMPPMPE